MAQVIAPRELIQKAGTLTAAAASVVLSTSMPAAGQNSSPPPTPTGQAPWMQKADPKIVEDVNKQAEAERAAQIAAVQAAAMAKTEPAEQPVREAGDGKAQVKVSEQMTVDLHVKDESISNVLELLSIQSQKNIIASKNVTGKVSADLFNVTFYQALDAILHVNGFQYVEKGTFIYVYTREEFLEIQKALSKRVAKVMRLNYLNASDAEGFVKPLLSQGGDIKTATKTPEFSISGEAPTGKDDYALGAVLVVIDYEENIEAIEKLLVEIDTRPAQVLVEATILETQVVEANAFGVDFSIIGDLDFLEFAGLGGPRSAAQALIRGGSGASGGLSPADNRGGAISTSPGNTQDGRSTVKIGVVAGPIGIFMRALDDVSDFTVLSSPKLLALNRMPSRVLVGQRVGYLNTTATETSTTQTVQFLDTGTTLYFRPFVSSTGEIRMELKPKVASATIRDAGNGQGGIVSIPDETTQEITTNVIVKDGHTIVLGGLFVERTTAFRKQVPFFGDIPLIGAAFRGHDDSTDRRELIFLIRPQIMGETALAMQGVDVKNEIERIRAGQRQGLLPFSREKMTSVLNVEAETAAREGRTEEALWKLQRSLSLNSRQPDAIRLREKITAEKENWPTNFLLEGVITGEINSRMEAVPTRPGSPHRRPHGSVNIPRERIKVAEPQSAAPESIFDRTLRDAMTSEAEANATPASTDEAAADLATPAHDESGWSMTTETTPGLQPVAGSETNAATANTPMTGASIDEAATGDPMGEQTAINPPAETPGAAESMTDASPYEGPWTTPSYPGSPIGQASPAMSAKPALISPISPEASGAEQRRATRMSTRSFFRALFLGPTNPAPSMAETPADDAQRQQEVSK
ncbi:MAG: hypothetical protein AB7K52_02460 [Phycisphaerales bacterium]